MATHEREEALVVVATEDLSNAKYKCVTFNGTIAQAADKARVAGISRFVATSGNHANAVYDGITKAVIGGAVTTAGWPLKVANSGFLVACASGDMAVARLRYVGSVASGDIVSVLAGFTMPSVWGG